MLTTEVENFPGFVDGVQGPELMASFRSQAARFGAEFRTERVTNEPFDLRARPRYDLVIDRLAYWYHLPREWLKKIALMDDVYLLNNPFTFQAMEKHAAYCAMMRLGLNVPETWLIPPTRPTRPSNARGQSSSVPSSKPIRWLESEEGVTSAEPRQMMRDLGPPRGPVVRDVVAPEVELTADALVRHDPGEALRARERAGRGGQGHPL